MILVWARNNVYLIKFIEQIYFLNLNNNSIGQVNNRLIKLSKILFILYFIGGFTLK